MISEMGSYKPGADRIRAAIGDRFTVTFIECDPDELDQVEVGERVRLKPRWGDA